MRPPRFEIADGIYHVTSRAARQQLLFRDDLDREAFLSVLGTSVHRAGWICLDYCLIGTHYHLVLQTPEPNLALGMKRLNWLYSRTFNARHKTKGHLFEARYHSEFVQTSEHLVRTHRYVALNPVKAGLVRSPRDWHWGGYRALVGLEEPRSFHDRPRALREMDDRDDVAVRQLLWIVEGILPVYDLA